MDCHKCKFVGTVIGSAHKSCKVLADTKLDILIASGLAEIQISKKDGTESKPAVEVNPWGKSHGWADWPIQFDPIWIDSCVFFAEPESASFPQPR